MKKINIISERLKIERAAKEEIKAERFREAVEAYKLKLKNKKSIWDKIFHFKIIRKDSQNV